MGRCESPPITKRIKGHHQLITGKLIEDKVIFGKLNFLSKPTITNVEVLMAKPIPIATKEESNADKYLFLALIELR